MIYGIVAQSENGIIGKQGKLPWKLPDDMKHFRLATGEGIVVMGSKTFKSLGEKPLPNRVNIVMTRDRVYPTQMTSREDFYVCHDVDEVLDIYESLDKPLWVIGGSEIYELFKPWYDNLYISYVDGEYEGDTLSPFTESFMEDFKAYHTVSYNKFHIVYYERKR